MKRNLQSRKVLKTKISQTLKEDIKALPTQMQNILIDDLITAFESRMAAFSKAQSNLECVINVGVEVLQ